MNRICSFLSMTLVACLLAGCCNIGGSTKVIAETDETVDNWRMARYYQAEGRYELAKQHYSLALSTVRTQSGLEMLKRDLYAVDMQLRAMR